MVAQHLLDLFTLQPIVTIMGLSGRKTKQRIGNDPRNLAWVDDAAKFGQAYLSKFGWDSSKGLGVSGDGRTNTIKVTQKLDMLGIGMQHQNTPEGIAWRQSRDFESLLRRLNGATAGDDSAAGSAADSAVPAGFHRAMVVENGEGDGSKKRKSVGVMEVEQDDKVLRKKWKREGRSKRREGESRADGKAEGVTEESGSEARQLKDPQTVDGSAPKFSNKSASFRSLPRSHRARHHAMRRLAANTPNVLSEILGISSSSSSSSPPTPALVEEEATVSPAMEQLTTATQSVAEYFKAKLAAKSDVQFSFARTPSSTDEQCTPRMGLGMRARVEDNQTYPGINMASTFSAMFAPAEVITSVTEEETLRGEASSDVKNEGRKQAREARRLEKAERKRLKAESKVSQTRVAEMGSECLTKDEHHDPPARKSKKRKSTLDDVR